MTAKDYNYLTSIDSVLKQEYLDDHTKLFMIKQVMFNWALENKDNKE